MPSLSALVGPRPASRGSEEYAPEPLPAWRNAWRLVVVYVIGAIFLLTVYAPVLAEAPRVEPERAVPWMAIDFVAGQLAVVLAAFRRRAPVVLMLVTMALTGVSAFAVPAACLAALSLATRRRPAPLVWGGVINLLAGLVHTLWVVPEILPVGRPDSGTPGRLAELGVNVVFATLFYAIVVLIGWNIGSRRELVASWRRQAETANREQAARVSQAQLAERARIAREMHDVLAHRLSLVAMHAGVLAHRPDLSEEERAEAAEIVRAGTHQALEELREVLGVLRDEDEGTQGRVEAPQPGLSGIPSLVAEVTSSGQEVRLVVEEDLWRRSLSLPTSTGRHAYRVVQEALTNARRHSRGGAATVEVDGAPGRGLSIEVSNPATPVEEGSLPSGGRGLAGMSERVQLAGGRFEAGVEVSNFVVRAWMPWPEQGGEDD